jgi:hypothetical protein
MDSEGIPQDKAELIALIADEWMALLQIIDKTTPDQMTTPDVGGWSPKDNLAHLAAWEGFMIRRYLQGQPPHEAIQIEKATLEHLEEDDINQILFERNRLRSVDDVLQELQQTHATLLDTLEQMTFADLMQPISEDAQHRPLIIWVMGNTYQHYREHRETMQAMIDK